MTQTGHRIKWDHFDILATVQSDTHCKIQEALLIRDLKQALNENIGSEKLLLYSVGTYVFPADGTKCVFLSSTFSLSLLSLFRISLRDKTLN